VDVVGDAHALPFLPETLDFIFSLAVVEHLRQPFVAAQEMDRALRPGGYVFHDYSFVYPYHGVPHHYFNATHQGLAEIFAPFILLRSGVEPYQMPSFAIRSLLETYLALLGHESDLDVGHFRQLVRAVLDQPLGRFDGLLSEEAARYVAAGTFYFGVKLPNAVSAVIPAVLRSQWEQRADLQERFPNIYNLGTAENVLLWAKSEGRLQVEAIAAYFDCLVPFRKRGAMDSEDQRAFDMLPVVESRFTHIPDA
jgi:SAM-dependent methyltransferase